MSPQSLLNKQLICTMWHNSTSPQVSLPQVVMCSLSMSIEHCMPVPSDSNQNPISSCITLQLWMSNTCYFISEVQVKWSTSPTLLAHSALLIFLTPYELCLRTVALEVCSLWCTFLSVIGEHKCFRGTRYLQQLVLIKLCGPYWSFFPILSVPIKSDLLEKKKKTSMRNETEQ